MADLSSLKDLVVGSDNKVLCSCNPESRLKQLIAIPERITNRLDFIIGQLQNSPILASLSPKTNLSVESKLPGREKGFHTLKPFDWAHGWTGSGFLEKIAALSITPVPRRDWSMYASHQHEMKRRKDTLPRHGLWF